ncbi:MAG: thiazole synthase, partial [Sphingobacteriales bacterium]
NDAVNFLNTAIAVSENPVQMALAFKLACQAGRIAYEARLAKPVNHAIASSPLTAFLDE